MRTGFHRDNACACPAFDTNNGQATVRASSDHPSKSDGRTGVCGEWRGLILLGAHTGLRGGDGISLQRENIEGTDIVIRPKKTTRTRNTIRIPMTPPVVAWIGDRQGSFFPDLSKRTTSTHSTTFANLLKKVGVPREVKLPGGIAARRSFHSLRHRFTSWLAEADIHRDVRRKLTGHKSEGVHASYTHHDASLKRAIAELPDLSSQG